jgi:hypothetical protein
VTPLTWYCSNCNYGVPQAPHSAARALPEQCPGCKSFGVIWTTWRAVPALLLPHPTEEQKNPGGMA